MAEAVDIKKQIIDDMLETLKEQVSRYKSLINSNDVTLDQLKDFDNQISEIYDTLQKVSNTQLTLLVSEIEDYKTQFQTKLSEFENILNNIDISNLTLTPEQIESLKGDNGLSAYQIAVNEGFEGTELKWLESLKGKDFAFENMTQVQKDDLLNHFLSSSEITSILQRLDNLENNQGSTTPPNEDSNTNLSPINFNSTFVTNNDSYAFLTNYSASTDYIGEIKYTFNIDGEKTIITDNLVVQLISQRLEVTSDIMDFIVINNYKIYPYVLMSRTQTFIIGFDITDLNDNYLSSSFGVTVEIVDNTINSEILIVEESNSWNYVVDNWYDMPQIP